MGRLVKDRRQSLLCQPPVLKLASGVVRADRHKSAGAARAEPSQDVFLQRLGKRWRCGNIEANLGPGVGTVGMLPSGPARGSKAPLKLRVGYGVSVNNHRAVDSHWTAIACILWASYDPLSTAFRNSALFIRERPLIRILRASS